VAKLRPVGLLTFFEISNIFCSSPTALSRNHVLNLASNTLSIDEVGVVVGDTPNDIWAARQNGLHCISIASGAFSYEDLRQFNPDWLLDIGWNANDFLNAMDSFL
jgi:phosphoglycolate phosphatase-like HAD superfamily hydrolase